MGFMNIEIGSSQKALKVFDHQNVETFHYSNSYGRDKIPLLEIFW